MIRTWTTDPRVLKKVMDDYKRYPELVELLEECVKKVNEITGLDWTRVIDWEKIKYRGE